MKPRLGHRTLSAAIVEQLRRDILDGTYAAGDQLRQDALAASFEVSRIPVREALFQLEAEGLVLIEPHKGAIVSAFSLEEIDRKTLPKPRHWMPNSRAPLPRRTWRNGGS
jgi:DNA-binding GntR family transcriptional regulator